MQIASSSGWRRTTMNTGRFPDEEAQPMGRGSGLIRDGDEEEGSSRILGQFIEEVRAWRLGPDGEEPSDTLLHLSLRLLHWRLKRSASAYRLALEAARLPKVTEGEGWHRQTLVESDGLQLGLVTIFSGGVVPLGAEQPARHTMSLVVSGDVSLQRLPLLDLCTDDAEAEVFLDSRQAFAPGEIVSCTPAQALTHRLEASTDQAVLLEALLARGEYGAGDAESPDSSRRGT